MKSNCKPPMKNSFQVFCYIRNVSKFITRRNVFQYFKVDFHGKNTQLKYGFPERNKQHATQESEILLKFITIYLRQIILDYVTNNDNIQ